MNLIRLAIVCLATIPVATGAQKSPTFNAPVFTIVAFRQRNLVPLHDARDASQQSVLATHSLRPMRSPYGEEAIVDDSLVLKGALSAANSHFVDLSWDSETEAPHIITRDEHFIANVSGGISAFRDVDVIPGSTYRYGIIPLLPSDAMGHAGGWWSLLIHVPSDQHLSLHEQAEDVASRAHAVLAATTTVSWVTFIRERRIGAAPRPLCEYGTDYEFSGDNHDFDWSSDRFRTAMHAVITWNGKKVSGNTAVGPTKIFKKGSDKVVEQHIASKSGMSVMKKGSSASTVDVHFKLHASNPFCRLGAIDGEFTMTIAQGGSYKISSGSHRQVPHHYIYIFNNGKLTEVYRKKAKSLRCLIGEILCDPAPLKGITGKFRE